MSDEAVTPCPDGFVWIGQSFEHCDACGLPAWDHTGWSEPNGEMLSPFDMRPWVLKPFEPGEADAVRAKWEVTE